MLNQSDSSVGGETAGSDLRTLASGCADARRLADAVIRDQFQRWRSGRGRSAEEYLHEHPLLTADPELLLDVVYAEYRVRDELGQRPDQAEFLRRFPALSDSLRRQFEVGGWLHGDPSAAGAATRVEDAETATLDQPALPLTLADFELGPRIGAGAMGEVFTARQRSLNRPVAIKFLRREVTAGAERRRRFLREATAAAAVRHPGVVAIHGVGQDDGRLFLVLERVDGAGLDARLKAGPVPVDEALRITIALADALVAIHRASVLHRDLKPANVLLNRDGRVQVADFGLSKPLDEHASALSLEGQLIGTPQYMAPEQADPRWGPIGPATDVYGVGAVLFALLTGRPPATGETLATLLAVVSRGEAQRSPRCLRADVPAALDAVCQRCLAPLPGDRYPTAAELRDALLECSRSSGARGVTTPTVTFPAPWNWRRRPWLWTAVATACVAVLVWATRPPQQLTDPPAPSAAPPAVQAPVTESDVVWQVEVFRQSRPDQSERLTENTPLLRTGDAVRIEVQFAAPQFAHLFWIGSDGTIRPLASAYDAAAQPSTRLSVPLSASDALPLTPPAGLELCVIVYSPQALESAGSWSARLQLPGGLTAPDNEHAIAGFTGELLTGTRPPTDAVGQSRLPTELEHQLTHGSRPVGAAVRVRAPTLQQELDEWRLNLKTLPANVAYLALRHAPR